MRRPARLAFVPALVLACALPLAAQDDAVPEAPDPEAREELLLPEEAAAAPPLPGGETEAAPTVRAVEVRSDVPLSAEDRAEVRQLVVLASGEPLDDERVGRTLRNVQASGLASRVGLYTRPADGGGVVAVVVLRGNVIVEAVRVEGETGSVDRRRLQEALFQNAGEPLVESRLVRGVYRLQEIFEDAGHFEARVRLAPEIDEARRRATVVYRVEAGPRATVRSVSFDGDVAPLTADELRAQVRTAVGDPFRRAQTDRDGERLESWLIGEGYRAARVEPPVVSYDAEAAAVAVSFPLTVGPRVEVEVRGAELERLRKRDLVPFLDGEGYDEALLLLAEQRIREDYQRRGHYDVEVDGREERPGEGVLRVVLEIEPGLAYELRQVSFRGNRAYSDGRLRELIETQPAGALTALPLVSGGRLVDDTLSGDLDNLRAFYALDGYVDAEVGPPEVERRDGGLFLTIPIEEGARQRVAELALEGVEAFEPQELRGEMALRAGGPFHPRLLENSLNRIRARYDRQGYDGARVSATTDWNPEHTLVDVTVRVLEGPQTVVDQVIVRGNQRTDTEVVRRAVGLQPGEPVSRSRLLESERSLYRLGIFSRVELDLTPAPLGATTRDVVVRVEEGQVRSLRYGVSAEYDDERGEWSLGGSLGWSHGNLFGRAITLSADARVLSRGEQYRLFVDQPTVGGWPVSVNYSLFQTQESRTSFEVERRGVRVEAVHQRGDEGGRYGLAYDYRLVDNRPLDDVRADRDDLRREDQTLRVAGLVPSVFLDRRNDPFNPTRGWTALAQLQYTFPLFNAEAEFVKLFLQHSHYLDVGFGTLGLSVRLGGIEPLAPLPAGIRDPFIPEEADLPSREVFLAERFFAGGETSHRAYQRDRLGIPFSTCLGEGEAVDPDCAATLFPTGDGPLTPAGGNGLALVNVDLRVPVFGAMEGVLFYDAGNVWADWRQIRFEDFRSGVGLEVRYASPVGPLRVGVGFPIDRIEGADERVWFLSLGAPF